MLLGFRKLSFFFSFFYSPIAFAVSGVRFGLAFYSFIHLFYGFISSAVILIYYNVFFFLLALLWLTFLKFCYISCFIYLPCCFHFVPSSSGVHIGSVVSLFYSFLVLILAFLLLFHFLFCPNSFFLLIFSSESYLLHLFHYCGCFIMSFTAIACHRRFNYCIVS